MERWRVLYVFLGLVSGMLALAYGITTNAKPVLVGTLACLCVATIAVWILVPRQYTGTFVQFALAFTERCLSYNYSLIASQLPKQAESTGFAWQNYARS